MVVVVVVEEEAEGMILPRRTIIILLRRRENSLLLRHHPGTVVSRDKGKANRDGDRVSGLVRWVGRRPGIWRGIEVGLHRLNNRIGMQEEVGFGEEAMPVKEVRDGVVVVVGGAVIGLGMTVGETVRLRHGRPRLRRDMKVPDSDRRVGDDLLRARKGWILCRVA